MIKSLVLKRFCECLLEIGDDIFDILDADRDSYKSAVDSRLDKHFVAELTVSRACGVENTGMDCCDVNRVYKERERVHEFFRLFSSALYTERNDTACALFEIFQSERMVFVAFESGVIYVFGIAAFLQKLRNGERVFTMTLQAHVESLDAEIEQLIAQRQEARKAKDFALADKIRDKITAMGIVLEDTREGVKWHRK